MRPITPVEEFDEACIKAKLNNNEQKIIDHIRYVGVFNQPSLTKDLKINSKMLMPETFRDLKVFLIQLMTNPSQQKILF